MPFNVPTQPGPTRHDPHTVNKLRNGEKCSICGELATRLRYGRPACKQHA